MNRSFKIVCFLLLALLVSTLTVTPTALHQSKKHKIPKYSNKTRILDESNPSNETNTVKAKVEAGLKSGDLQKIKQNALSSNGDPETIWVDDEEPTYELYEIPEYKDANGYPVYMLIPADEEDDEEDISQILPAFPKKAVITKQTSPKQEGGHKQHSKRHQHKDKPKKIIKIQKADKEVKEAEIAGKADLEAAKAAKAEKEAKAAQEAAKAAKAALEALKASKIAQEANAALAAAKAANDPEAALKAAKAAKTASLGLTDSKVKKHKADSKVKQSEKQVQKAKEQVKEIKQAVKQKVEKIVKAKKQKKNRSGAKHKKHHPRRKPKHEPTQELMQEPKQEPKQEPNLSSNEVPNIDPKVANKVDQTEIAKFAEDLKKRFDQVDSRNHLPHQQKKIEAAPKPEEKVIPADQKKSLPPADEKVVIVAKSKSQVNGEDEDDEDGEPSFELIFIDYDREGSPIYKVLEQDDDEVDGGQCAAPVESITVPLQRKGGHD